MKIIKTYEIHYHVLRSECKRIKAKNKKEAVKIFKETNPDCINSVICLEYELIKETLSLLGSVVCIASLISLTLEIRFIYVLLSILLLLVISGALYWLLE